MKNLKYLLVLLIAVTLALSSISAANAAEPPASQEEEGSLIPPDAHEKAIEAVKALGPERGAVSISSRCVKILGITRNIVSKSEKIKAALNDLGAKETDTGYRIELSGDVLFDFDKFDIRPEAEDTLKKVGDVINATGSTRVIISGHTDSKGSDSYNQTLSEKRAESVKNWLASNTGVDEKVIETSGYGESKPVTPNTNPDGTDNPEGRQKNRRVEILVKKK